MSKSFSLSKEGLKRIKSLGLITKNTFLTRELFVSNGNTKGTKEKALSSTLFRTAIKDIPDDLCMPIFDIPTFLSVVQSFDEVEIDYEHLDDKNYVIIYNKNNKKEKFLYYSSEPNLMTNNLDVEKEAKLKEKIKSNVINSAVLKKSDLESILSSSKVISPRCISLSWTDAAVNFQLYDSDIVGANYYETEINNDVSIMDSGLFFNLSFEFFSKLERGSDYTVSTYAEKDKKECYLISFENKDDKLAYYFSKYHPKYKIGGN